MICNAKLRCRDAFCKKFAIAGRTRCSLHGGKSLVGAQHPNYRHGRCTFAARQRSVETTARLRFLEMLAIELGMIPRKR